MPDGLDPSFGSCNAKKHCLLILSFLTLLSQVGSYGQWAGLLAGGEVVYPLGIMPVGAKTRLSEVRQPSDQSADVVMSIKEEICGLSFRRSLSTHRLGWKAGGL